MVFPCANADGRSHARNQTPRGTEQLRDEILQNRNGIVGIGVTIQRETGTAYFGQRVIV